MMVYSVHIKFDYYFLFKSSLLSTFDVQYVVKKFLNLLGLKMETTSVPTKLVKYDNTGRVTWPVSQIMWTFFC